MSAYKLLWTHPRGDPMWVPCIHPVQQHPGGHGIVPCIHISLAHPNGEHPNGDPVPCFHIVPQHPQGDPALDPNGHVIVLPCLHPLPVHRFEPALHLIFHTNNANVQTAVLEAVNMLKNKFGIKGIGNPLRPLHVCARDWVEGFPQDATNPFWSHYERDTHAIQICPVHYTNRGTIFHELGHALAGTQLPRIRRWSHDPHEMKTAYEPGLAMSEGWAHFVALALLNAQGAPMPAYCGETDWETRDPAVAKTNDIEYNIACVLWDLYDKNNDMEKASFSFKELFSVLSPTLETIDTGLIITGIDDYLDRLRMAHPDRVQTINCVRDIHLSSKKLFSGLSGGPGGGEFWDDVDGVLGISRIVVQSGAVIDAIQTDYNTPNGVRQSNKHGGTGGSESVRSLAPGEWIESIDGQTDGSIVKQVTFNLSRRIGSNMLRSPWSVGEPGQLWITLAGTSDHPIRLVVVPGGTISIGGNTVPVPASTRVGSTLHVPGVGNFVVGGENAFHIDCTQMLGFYGRSGTFLDAIGVMYQV